MENKNIEVKIGREENEVERLAILLSLTESQEEEKEYIELYKKMGYLSAVTGIAGMDDEVKKKLMSAIVGAGLNEGVIKKTRPEMHAVIHATADAAVGAGIDTPIAKSFQLKATIVRKGDWICVAIYGNKAIHKVTNHKTMGIGVMHL